MRRIVLFGNGAIARTTYHDFSRCSSEYDVVGFSVDPDYLQEKTLFGLPVVPFGEVESVFPPDQCDMLIAIGYTAMNRLRAERYLQAKAKGYRLVNFVSPNTVIYPGLEIGENCQISHNCTIFQDVRIGNNVTVGANSTIGHDVIIHDHCFIGSAVAIAGHVTVGPYCFMGTNSTIRNQIHVGRESVIGAGALVLEDTQDHSVYLGQSAEVLPITSRELAIQ
jgi:sugar O-acyltransferase (sialic acid O-acetyltransferase NeuD family)